MLISALPFTAVSASQDHANDQTRRLIRQIMMQQRIPGLQVAVVRDGQIVLSEAYGQRRERRACFAPHPLPAQLGRKAFTGVAPRSWRRRGD